MRVIKSTASEVLLRGYKVNAMTPFEFDLANYGLSVILSNGKVVKCAFHMYDRNVDIEYRKVNSACSSEQQNNESKVREEQQKMLPEAELLVKQALSKLASGGNDGDETYCLLYKAWKSICNNPKQLKDIQNYKIVGCGMTIFLSYYGTLQDFNDKQHISGIAYLCLSLALKSNPKDVNNRLILMLKNEKDLEYTVSSVVNKDEDMMSVNMHPFKARDAIFKMEYADLSKDNRLLSIDMFASAKRDLTNKIQTGFFGNNQSESTIISEGEKLHNDVLDFLINKVFKEEDINFYDSSSVPS